MCRKRSYRKSQKETIFDKLKYYLKFGLSFETYRHTAGIASNRKSVSCGEYVLGSRTHRPSRPERSAP